MLSREKLATSTEGSSEIGLYLSSDESGASILRASPPALEDFNILSRGINEETDRDHLVIAHSPATGSATITGLTHLDPSELLKNDLIGEIPDNQISEQIIDRIRSPITIQLISRPITPETDKVGIGGPPALSPSKGSLKANSQIQRLRTRELTVFSISP